MANEVVTSPLEFTQVGLSDIDAENDIDIIGSASDSKIKTVPVVLKNAMIPFAVCNSDSASQAKAITIPGLVVDNSVPVKIVVQFAMVNSAGTIQTGGNTVTDSSAPFFVINGDTTHPVRITVAGENAGPGFNSSGERLEFFIYGGTADCNAADRYNVVGDTFSYRKQRDGKIEMLLLNTVKGTGVSTLTLNLPIAMYDTTNFYADSSGFSSDSDFTKDYYWEASTTKITLFLVSKTEPAFSGGIKTKIESWK